MIKSLGELADLERNEYCPVTGTREPSRNFSSFPFLRRRLSRHRLARVADAHLRGLTRRRYERSRRPCDRHLVRAADRRVYRDGGVGSTSLASMLRLRLPLALR